MVGREVRCWLLELQFGGVRESSAAFRHREGGLSAMKVLQARGHKSESCLDGLVCRCKNSLGKLRRKTFEHLKTNLVPEIERSS